MRSKPIFAALIGFGGMLVLAGVSEAQGPGGAPPGVPAAQPGPAVNRPVIAVFNMVAVMKEYKKAKYQVYMLTEERKKLSGNINVLKADYLKLQQENQIQQNPTIREANQKKMTDLARQIEDKTKEIDKALNDQATVIISALYDEIKTVVDKTAEMNGYHIVFAYPDASSADEAKSAYMKELKLKPPAAQPFFVARQVDITGVVIQTLNTWYPSQDPPAAAAAQQQQPQTQTPPAATPGRP
jgi:Skp family chaperone for outer membrane proteins